MSLPFVTSSHAQAELSHFARVTTVKRLTGSASNIISTLWLTMNSCNRGKTNFLLHPDGCIVSGCFFYVCKHPNISSLLHTHFTLFLLRHTLYFQSSVFVANFLQISTFFIDCFFFFHFFIFPFTFLSLGCHFESDESECFSTDKLHNFHWNGWNADYHCDSMDINVCANRFYCHLAHNSQSKTNERKKLILFN